MKYISSTQNIIIKNCLQLKEKSRERRKKKKFIVEGKKEVLFAIDAGYNIEHIFICELFDKNEDLIPLRLSNKIIIVSDEVYAKIAYRDNAEGLIAIAHSKYHTLDSLNLPESKNLLILVAESLEKPGNIGALFRTADAAKLDAVIIANPKTDLYNPNIIRSSLGCVFSLPIAEADSSEIITFLKERSINIYCATLKDDAEIYHRQNYNTSSAIVVGSENIGLSKAWIDNGKHIIIPMQGHTDSMNVSVSAGIIVFEAKKQRLFKI